MRKLLLISAIMTVSVAASGPTSAVAEVFFWGGPAEQSDAAYWPAYRAPERVDGPDCVKWNWQQHSYYNYCAPLGRFIPRARTVLRVRG
jgi:hypothetical protein